MSTQLRIKQGAAFSCTLTVRDSGGALVNLSAAAMSAGLATAAGVAVPGLAIAAIPDAPGQALMTADGPSATALWPVGVLRGDIAFAGSGVSYSDTFLVFVERAITPPPPGSP